MQSEKSPLTRAVPGMNAEDAVTMLFEAALRKTYTDLSETESNGATPFSGIQPVVTQQAVNCFQSGIPEEEVVRHTIFHYYLRKQETLIRQIIRNVYTESKGFGTKINISKEQQLALQTDDFMKRRYAFRFNTQMGEVEYRERHSFRFRFNPIDKRALNSIALDAQFEGIPLWDRDISRYIYSNRVPIFNPLEDFLYNLPGWDGKDRICALAATVPCKNPHWKELFHRWFLNMVAHWKGIIRNMRTAYRRCWWVLKVQISATQQGFLKHILQKPVVNVQKPYASAVLEMRRYASFIATSNQKDLLTDPSGSRRFICIEVTGVIDTRHPINYEQLYAQAMYELEHGERYWFDEQDELIMTENNREFEQVPAEEQLFYKYFRPAGEEEEGEWLSPAEIKKNSKLSISGKRVSVFGRILQKQGVRSRRTRRGTEYCVVRME